MLISLKNSEIQFPELTEMYTAIKEQNIVKFYTALSTFIDFPSFTDNNRLISLFNNSAAIESNITNIVDKHLGNINFDINISEDGSVTLHTYDINLDNKKLWTAIDELFEYVNEYEIYDLDYMIEIRPEFAEKLDKIFDNRDNYISQYNNNCIDVANYITSKEEFISHITSENIIF